MIENAELQELYSLLADVLDGFNRTHETQVLYVDFSSTDQNSEIYNGSLVVREYVLSIIDYYYRDLCEDDFDWFDASDWLVCNHTREIERILSERRKEAQRYHREGRDLSTLWYIRHRNDESQYDFYHGSYDRRRYVSR